MCQSCGMPLSDDMYGTNKDGSINEEYCKYCFENGHFTNPDITMEEMINICVEYMTEDGKMTEEEARKIIKNSLPTLKRWEVK
ncbi:MAG: zinc ribbon domain-containing protein [Bacteroidales bacterium]|nr:zinc ribbon domain-containing protein [Bacteroidales bacterium]